VPNRIVTSVYRPKRLPRKRKAVALGAAIITSGKRAAGPARSVQASHRIAEQPASPTYWLSTKAELKDPTIPLHMEGCPIRRRKSVARGSDRTAGERPAHLSVRDPAIFRQRRGLTMSPRKKVRPPTVEQLAAVSPPGPTLLDRAAVPKP
jgi:hypothetical protein